MVVKVLGITDTMAVIGAIVIAARKISESDTEIIETLVAKRIKEMAEDLKK